MKYVAALLLASTAWLAAEVKVTLGEISDKRTSGQNFKGLEVNLKISGSELAEVKGVRVKLAPAKDDAGREIKAEGDRFGAGGFSPLEKPFGFGNFGEEKKKDEYGIKLEFENPARAAKTVTINSALEMLVPAKDPQSIITASPAKDAGKPLASPALKAAGVEITLSEAKGDELGYRITDPNGAVAAVEFCAPDGKALESSGRMSSGFGGARTVSQSFRSKPPKDAVAKVYLKTDKSVITVPLKLEGVQLP